MESGQLIANEMVVSKASAQAFFIALLIKLSSAQSFSICFGPNSICTISEEMYTTCSDAAGSGSNRNVTTEFTCLCESGYLSVLQAYENIKIS